MASSRALGIMEKLVGGPLFRQVVSAGHIFALSRMRESLFNFLQLCSKDSSELLDRKTMFDDSSVTLGRMYKILDSLTQECLQIMCWSCSLLIKH